jgi:hypothetical protein
MGRFAISLAIRFLSLMTICHSFATQHVSIGVSAIKQITLVAMYVSHRM